MQFRSSFCPVSSQRARAGWLYKLRITLKHIVKTLGQNRFDSLDVTVGRRSRPVWDTSIQSCRQGGVWALYLLLTNIWKNFGQVGYKLIKSHCWRSMATYVPVRVSRHTIDQWWNRKSEWISYLHYIQWMSEWKNDWMSTWMDK